MTEIIYTYICPVRLVTIPFECGVTSSCKTKAHGKEPHAGHAKGFCGILFNIFEMILQFFWPLINYALKYIILTGCNFKIILKVTKTHS